MGGGAACNGKMMRRVVRSQGQDPGKPKALDHIRVRCGSTRHLHGCTSGCDIHRHGPARCAVHCGDVGLGHAVNGGDHLWAFPGDNEPSAEGEVGGSDRAAEGDAVHVDQVASQSLKIHLRPIGFWIGHQKINDSRYRGNCRVANFAGRRWHGPVAGMLCKADGWGCRKAKGNDWEKGKSGH